MFFQVKEGFWGYHDRINDRIREVSDGTEEFEDESMMTRGLKKQRAEIENIMGQYVFYRFCQRISVYLTQAEVVMLLIISLITAVFVHSALLNRDYLWMGLWLWAYSVYLLSEISGPILKFEVWATHMFLKQYKVLSGNAISTDIIQAKKENKKTLTKIYILGIVPLSVILFGVLSGAVIFPLMPLIPAVLQINIFKMWGAFMLAGGGIMLFLPVFLDKILNSRFRYSFSQLKENHSALFLFGFLSLLLAVIIQVAKFLI